MEPQKLINDPIKGFGLNRFSYEEHGTLEAKNEPHQARQKEPDENREPEDDLKKEEEENSEETTLNTSGVQEGLNERAKDSSEELDQRSA